MKIIRLLGLLMDKVNVTLMAKNSILGHLVQLAKLNSYKSDTNNTRYYENSQQMST